MKSLALLLLLCIGIHGFSIVQQDEPEHEPEHEKPGTKESLKSIIRDIYVFGALSTAELTHDNPEERKKYPELLDTFVTHISDLFSAICDFAEEAHAEVEKEISVAYPTFYTKVLPIYEEYSIKIIEHIWTLKDEIDPHFKTAFEEIQKQLLTFYVQLFSTYQKHEETFKSYLKNLEDAAKPFADQVHQEVEAERQKEADRKRPAKPSRDPLAKYKEIFGGTAGTNKAESAIRVIEKIKEVSLKQRHGAKEVKQ
ncbi:uncharacterized protein [Hyperolius riggenbachi]|uniref:uncharacterized protein n=1 Tax=Hyperolius riggenbachi TaxID=752182 RepID=UPI0035A2B2D8